MRHADAPGTPALAQDRGPIGITMGYPGNVGAIWHVAERVAVEPFVSFSSSANDSRLESDFTINGVLISTSVITTEQEGWSMSPGVALRFRVAQWDAVSAYLAPAYQYVRGAATTVTTATGAFATGPAETEESETRGHAVNGMIGAQYNPHRRFAVFGEVGVRYSNVELRRQSDSPRQGPGPESHTRLFGNAARVGAILYF